MNLRPLRQHGMRDESGSAAVEYALLLVLVAGGLFVAAEALSTGVGRASDDLVAGFNGQRPAAGQAAGPAAAAADAPDSLAVPRSAAIGLLFVLLIAGGTVWQALHRRRVPIPPSGKPATDADSLAVPPQIFQKRQEILRMLSADLSAALESQMKVRHLMSQRLITVTPKTPFDVVYSLMIEKRVRHLLVCEEDGRLVGIISDRDVKARLGRFAADVMTPRPATVAPDSPVGPAITQMIVRSFSCLPVVSQERLVGIITSSDLMVTLQCTLQLLHKVATELQARPIEAAAEPALCEAAAGGENGGYSANSA